MKSAAEPVVSLPLVAAALDLRELAVFFCLIVLLSVFE